MKTNSIDLIKNITYYSLLKYDQSFSKNKDFENLVKTIPSEDRTCPICGIKNSIKTDKNIDIDYCIECEMIL